jgi:hypothetical protein
MFDSVKKLKPRLLFIALTQNGIIFSKKRFAKLAEIAYDTAYKIFLEVGTVLDSVLASKTETVASALFIDAFLKRSRYTPAGQHPRAEEDAMEEMTRGAGGRHGSLAGHRMPVGQSLSAEPRSSAGQSLPAEPSSSDGDVPVGEELPAGSALAADDGSTKAIEDAISALTGQDSDLQARAMTIYSHISERQTSFEELHYKTNLPTGSINAAITILLLAGLVTENGSYFSRIARTRRPAQSFDVLEAVEAFLSQVRAVFHGISRKNLQKYLAYLSFLGLGKRSSISLLDECLRFRSIDENDTTFYVTPLVVTICT